MRDPNQPIIPSDDKCNARLSKNRPGEYCRMHAGFGTDHPGFGRCKFHGGMLPDVRMFAHRLMVEEEVRNGFGAPVDVDPLVALLDLVKSYAGSVLWLQQKVLTLDETEMTEDTERGEVPSVWVRMHGEYAEKLARVAKLALDAGVDERLVRVAEEQGRWLTGTLDLVFAKLALTDEQLAVLPAIMSEVLAQLEPGDDVVDAEVVEDRVL